MTAVEVTIVQPLDGATVRGAGPVQLTGRVGTLPPELAGVTLHYRWYSSGSRAKVDQYSLNETALQDPAADFPAALEIGSQAITFAASDQPGQDKAAQNATSHGGVAGGSLGPKRCVIHVLRAVASRPAPHENLDRASSTLEADAPLHWPKPEYQALNRLRYHWRFEPDPADGRATVDIVPAVDALKFEATGTRSVVRRVGPLTGTDLGGYTMRLRVEDLQDPNIFDEAAVPVVIGP